MTTEYDLIIRNAKVATAADVYSADIGVAGGKVVALAQSIKGKATKEIDAAGRFVTPGGVDSHCHLDQPMEHPIKMADDFITGTRSAACGGTTTVIPFAPQVKGGTLKAALEDYHQRADGKASVDYAFHLIVCDPTEDVLNNELPSLVEKGYSSFKL
jgi:dihydropyrimidinase